MTERALAGPHRHRRVSLQQLDGTEPLGPGLAKILRVNVLAQADNAFLRPRWEKLVSGRRRFSERASAAALLCLGWQTAGFDDLADPDHRQARPLPEQTVTWDSAERENERVAGVFFSPAVDVDDCLSHSSAAGGLDDRATLDEVHVCAGRAQHVYVFRCFIALADDHDPSTGAESVNAGETGRAAREPDAGQIVAREYAVPLDGTGRHHHASRVDEVEDVDCVYRHERTLVDADCRGALEQRHEWMLSGLRRKSFDPGTGCTRREHLAGDAVVADDDGIVGGRSGEGGL